MIMMLIAIATGVGLQKKIKEKVSAFNGDIIISNFDTNYSFDSQNPISYSESGVFSEEFSAIQGITHIQATAVKSGIIRTATDFEGVVAKGVGTDYNWKFFEEYLVEGRLPNYSENLNAEILLSSFLTNRLQLNIGDKVVTYFVEGEDARPIGFDLVGIYNSGFQEFDETHLITDLRQIQRLNRWSADEVGAIELFVADFSKINTIGDAVYFTLPSHLDSQTIRVKYGSIFEWLDLFDFNIVLIIGIMILVAGINMITALLVLILERTPMIGILKALGSSDRSIRKIFLINAMYLISIGLFWGNLLGLGILFLQKQFKLFPLNPDTYYVTEAPVYLHWDYVLLLNLGTFILCLLMLLLPSYIVTRISPVKAIRFD
jgi:lipoprotein-releasing system permease protein